MKFIICYPETGPSVALPVETAHGVLHHPKGTGPIWTNWIARHNMQGVEFTDVDEFNAVSKQVVGVGLRFRTAPKVIIEDDGNNKLDAVKAQLELRERQMIELRERYDIPTVDLAKVRPLFVPAPDAPPVKIRFTEIATQLGYPAEAVKTALEGAPDFEIKSGGWVSLAIPTTTTDENTNPSDAGASGAGSMP